MALGAAPTTQPAAGKVVVLPFAQTNPGAPEASVGQAIRQGVLAELMPYAPGRIQPLNQRANDDKAAIDAARKAGAAYVVIGNVVTVGPTVRFDGRVLDVNTGNAVAPLKATGPVDNPYPLETALADELGRAIGLTMPAPAPPPAAVSTANPWGTNNYPAANPYAPMTADVDAEAAGSDFGPYGYGGYPSGPYPGAAFAGRGGGYYHYHYPGLGVPSIAGGGGNAALNGGMPYGQFIPTNRAQSLGFNAYGGLGTVNIAGPAGPSGHAAGAGRR